MSAKRDIEDIDEGEISEPGPKRAKRQNGAAPRHHHQNSSIDPTWGQKYVFSSLEDASTIPYGEESDFEDDADAMAYLSSVRKEAYDIPHLLVAPKVQIGPQLPPNLDVDNMGHDTGESKVEVEAEVEGQADTVLYTKDVMRGYYDDGAYIAIPDDDWQGCDEDGEQDDEKELHDAYFASILRQYDGLRKILRSQQPTDAVKRLSFTQVTHAAPFGRNSNTIKVWTKLMRSTNPHPLQLALMSKETVIRIFRVLLGGTFLRRGHTLSERTSRWLWGLLARLPDRGELNHIEIGLVRDLGRRAVLLSRSLAEMTALREELADGELGMNEGDFASSGDEDIMATDSEDLEGMANPAPEDDTPVEENNETTDEHESKDTAPAHNGNQDEEDGEIKEESISGDDVAMDMDSGSGSENGEAVDEDLEAAKRDLLARLNDVSEAEDFQEVETDAQEEARVRLRMNMRATLNMILTVAGEFYGQRDLLEFREPFVSV
ncbi:hypothetical protein QQS21_010368 [Conoideocrella luteorostrata]|uniref:V-snare n=1 Tax=Conoideocrella luteorostrata TaxID=1105319 RepID=A0AAJ0FPF4_9HYPO|nr:hypothetical protein QQS21_010368 [Conoideocrella luteorostrata]